MTKWVLAAAMACVLGTGAVAVAEDSYYLELPTKGITASRKITVNVPDENPAQDGINPLTGESWYGNYYPILVNIDAHPEALPHWGVASADLIYEMPIQADGSTRELALFMGDYPDGAGCTLSSAIASNLALGHSVPEAVKLSKEYVTDAIRHAPGLGHGCGPLNHFCRIFSEE